MNAPRPLDRSELLAALRGLKRGDFEVGLPRDLPGVDGEIVRAVAEIADLMRGRGAELARVSEVARETNRRTEALLEQSRQQALTLQKSEALLIGQQEELKLTNERIREKVAQLALSSHYKSEFLATMSHELRTPLNSLLILARMLGDNAAGNLTPKQVEYAQNIHAAGTDLLSLISDILDLAKIESGTVTINVAPERVSDVLDFVERSFRQLTRDKDLDLAVAADDDVPAEVETDAKRLQQILKNLMSNAVKFTHSGSVALRVRRAESGWTPGVGLLDAARGVLAFDVADTGIGIAPNKHQLIFEAFRQADGSTSRAYGGTGLGLSISRELARLLGGEIRVSSAPGKGSTFTLFLPHAEALKGRSAFSPLHLSRPPVPGDDRASVRPGEGVVLIADDGARFAPALVDLVHACGFKAVVSHGTDIVRNARELRPAAISLNLAEREVHGWPVLEALRADPEARSIPISAYLADAIGRRCLHVGLIGLKPQPSDAKALEAALAAARRLGDANVSSVAVVERDRKRRDAIVATLRAEGVEATVLDRGFEILGALRRTPFDALVVGRVPGGHESATEWLEEIAEALPPVAPPMILLEREAPAVALPRMLEGVPALLEETARFLHLAANASPRARAESLAPRRASAGLEGRKVLLVDDDIRNIFALASALEAHGMQVVEAEDGKQALETLQATPDVEIILMDLMMPELDGFDTIRIIRGMEEHRDLPIIAVTAKALPGDRERSIEAGANDYLAKPVDMSELLAAMSRLLQQLQQPLGHREHRGGTGKARQFG